MLTIMITKLMRHCFTNITVVTVEDVHLPTKPIK